MFALLFALLCCLLLCFALLCFALLCFAFLHFALLYFNLLPFPFPVSHKAKVIYRATSGEAIAVALSIVAFVICMAGICVCYSWCYDDKRHYITPTHRHLYNRYRDRRGECREKNSLCNNTNVFYNRFVRLIVRLGPLYTVLFCRMQPPYHTLTTLLRPRLS